MGPSRSPSLPADKQPVFFPKLFSTIQNYSRALFVSDLIGGVIVGIVALPLAIAFAIASGVTPDRGLVTAIVAGFLISALGGSRVQIGGPTGAFVVIVYGIVEKYGVDGLIVCTLLAGLMLIAMGVLRLGVFIKFIPYPLTVGFTAGIAVIIFSSQLKDFFGLKTQALPGDFVGKWEIYFKTLSTLDVPTTLISAASLLFLIFWPRVSRKIPGSFLLIIVATILVQIFGWPVETIESRFGGIPTAFPTPHWPEVSFNELQKLVSPAFTVALLGAIESLLSATVADGMIEGRHRSNTELIAQGVANVVTPLFGGIPATGAIARTATNVKNGGKTPVAGMVHALTLLLIVLLFGRWARLIPLCVLSAILVVVAYNMSEWHAFKSLLKAPRTDVMVLLTSFFLTVFVDLTVAVEIGMLMSVMLFMKRMTDVTTVREVTSELSEKDLREADDAIARRYVPEGVEVYEAEGAFFFGVTEMLRDLLDLGRKPPRVIILRMRHVLFLDASGMRALNDLRKSCKKIGTQLVLSGIHSQPYIALDHAGLLMEFGEQNVHRHIDLALVRAYEIMGIKRATTLLTQPTPT